MTYDLITDMSLLTTIPESTLKKLAEKAKYIICHDVEESCLSENDVTDINIGIGTIKIKNTEEGVKYRFVPSSNLETSIMDTIACGKSPLEIAVEDAIVERLNKARKELI